MGAASSAPPGGRPLRWRLEAGALHAGSWLLRALPERAARETGARTALLGARAWPRQRRVALANLSVAFPDWAAARREALLAEHIRQLGRHAAEWARLTTASPQALLARFEFEGVRRLEAACADGRGALLVTAHFGCWELLLPALRARLPGHRFAAVGRAQRNPFLQRMIATRRTAADGHGALSQSAVAVRRALRDGGSVGLLADHYTAERRGGVLVPFLGRRAWTSPAPAKLARAHARPLLLVRTHPLPRGRHRVVVGPEVSPPARAEGVRGVAAATEQINDAISGWIVERPEQWLWLHARFRGSPDVPDAVARAGRRH